MPANVSVNARATVTAGLANDVDAVNQYAATIYAATANGTAAGVRRDPDTITPTSPNVATASLTTCGRPLRTCVDQAMSGASNITCASSTPATAPVNCAPAKTAIVPLWRRSPE